MQTYVSPRSLERQHLDELIEALLAPLFKSSPVISFRTGSISRHVLTYHAQHNNNNDEEDEDEDEDGDGMGMRMRMTISPPENKPPKSQTQISFQK